MPNRVPNQVPNPNQLAVVHRGDEGIFRLLQQHFGDPKLVSELIRSKTAG